VAYANNGKRLRQITEPRLFVTPFQSPQMFLWEHGLDDWHLVIKLPEYAPRRRMESLALQPTRLS
jgi:hypothetical protein